MTMTDRLQANTYIHPDNDDTLDTNSNHTNPLELLARTCDNISRGSVSLSHHSNVLIGKRDLENNSSSGNHVLLNSLPTTCRVSSNGRLSVSQMKSQLMHHSAAGVGVRQTSQSGGGSRGLHNNKQASNNNDVVMNGGGAAAAVGVDLLRRSQHPTDSQLINGGGVNGGGGNGTAGTASGGGHTLHKRTYTGSTTASPPVVSVGPSVCPGGGSLTTVIDKLSLVNNSKSFEEYYAALTKLKPVTSNASQPLLNVSPVNSANMAAAAAAATAAASATFGLPNTSSLHKPQQVPCAGLSDLDYLQLLRAHSSYLQPVVSIPSNNNTSALNLPPLPPPPPLPVLSDPASAVFSNPFLLWSLRHLPFATADLSPGGGLLSGCGSGGGASALDSLSYLQALQLYSSVPSPPAVSPVLDPNHQPLQSLQPIVQTQSSQQPAQLSPATAAVRSSQGTSDKVPNHNHTNTTSQRYSSGGEACATSPPLQAPVPEFCMYCGEHHPNNLLQHMQLHFALVSTAGTLHSSSSVISSIAQPQHHSSQSQSLTNNSAWKRPHSSQDSSSQSGSSSHSNHFKQELAHPEDSAPNSHHQNSCPPVKKHITTNAMSCRYDSSNFEHGNIHSRSPA